MFTGLAVIGFDWAYWEVAADSQHSRVIIVLGMALKLGVIVIAVGNWLAGGINAILLAIVGSDLVFAWLFWCHPAALRIDLIIEDL